MEKTNERKAHLFRTRTPSGLFWVLYDEDGTLLAKRKIRRHLYLETCVRLDVEKFSDVFVGSVRYVGVCSASEIAMTMSGVMMEKMKRHKAVKRS